MEEVITRLVGVKNVNLHGTGQAVLELRPVNATSELDESLWFDVDGSNVWHTLRAFAPEAEATSDLNAFNDHIGAVVVCDVASDDDTLPVVALHPLPEEDAEARQAQRLERELIALEVRDARLERVRQRIITEVTNELANVLEKYILEIEMLAALDGVTTEHAFGHCLAALRHDLTEE